MGYQAALIALSAISIVLLVPPLVWHSKALNIPAITLIVWLLLMSIKTFVDAIIWGGEDFASKYTGEGYCDVMVKLQVGADVGISSSVAGILINLFTVLKADSPIPGLKSTRRIITDLLISLATPVVVMALNYIPQSRRYYILQYSGCQTSYALSWVTIVVYTIWMVIWSFIGVVYAALIIFTFFRKRKDVSDILRCTNSGLTLVRFAKLLGFCTVMILVMFPLSMYIFTDGISGVSSTFDWSIVHSPVIWYIIQFVPLETPYYISWIYLALSYCVFVFFGLGTDAIEMYLSILSKIGFAGAIQWCRQKQQQRKIRNADKLMTSVFNTNTLNTPNGTTPGTQFDVEMQKILGDEDDKSPASTAVSNVFADKHALNKEIQRSTLNGINLDENMLEELDEEDLRYLNMLYENDHSKNKQTGEVQTQVVQTGSSSDLEQFNSNPLANSPTSNTNNSDIGFKYTLQQKR